MSNAATRLSLLSIEDEAWFQMELARTLGVFYDVTSAGSLADARKLLKEKDFDIVVLDNWLPDGEGVEFLNELSLNATPEPTKKNPVVLMLTSEDDFSKIQSALNRGASDYVKKQTTTLPELLVRIPIAIQNANIRREALVQSERATRQDPSPFLGESHFIQNMRLHIQRLRGRSTPVLITGETGTGKEVVARQIYLAEENPKRPFFAVNCGALTGELVESELFGHLRGSFTHAHKDRKGAFELADGGDLFLDEVGDLPLAAQVKLLRALQSGEIMPVGAEKWRKVNVRVIAATNRPLEQLVEKGLFREDLFYRLNVVRIETLPLRERKEDIPVLAAHFLAEFSNGRLQFSRKALSILERMSWKGNIRELRNSVESAVIAHDPRAGNTIHEVHSPWGVIGVAGGKKSRALFNPDELKLPKFKEDVSTESYNEFMRSAERIYLKQALELCDGDVAAAGTQTGLARSTIYKKVTDLGLNSVEAGHA